MSEERKIIVWVCCLKITATKSENHLFKDRLQAAEFVKSKKGRGFEGSTPSIIKVPGVEVDGVIRLNNGVK